MATVIEKKVKGWTVNCLRETVNTNFIAKNGIIIQSDYIKIFFIKCMHQFPIETAYAFFLQLSCARVDKNLGFKC